MGTTALTEAVFYILLSLDTPLHGYGIMQNVERLSGGRGRPRPPAPAPLRGCCSAPCFLPPLMCSGFA